MREIILAVCCATIVAFGQTTSNSKGYVNDEFAIYLPAPSEGFLCPVPQNEHNHGFIILLGGGDPKNCHDDVRHRYLSVFAFYNVTDDTEHLAGLLKMGCEAFGGACQPGPPGLQVPGLESITGKVSLTAGWIQIIVATQAGAPIPPSREPGVDYLFDLRTKPDHLEADLKVFRSILKTVKLSK